MCGLLHWSVIITWTTILRKFWHLCTFLWLNYKQLTQKYEYFSLEINHLNQSFGEYDDTTGYGKCPKISYTKVADKMAYANSADPDQTAPEGAV